MNPIFQAPDEVRKIAARLDQLYDLDTVEQALDRMAIEIHAALADRLPLLLCLMTGGIVLTGKLLQRLNFPLQLDYIHPSRYRGTSQEVPQGGPLEWIRPPGASVDGHAILIIDDILDRGITLAETIRKCRECKAASIHSAVLVQKQGAWQPRAGADFVGLQVPDRYVVGYGMDYRGYLRNAPGIYALPTEQRP